jgi:hypothetical protein
MSTLGHDIYLTVTFVTKRFRQRCPYTKLISLGGHLPHPRRLMTDTAFEFGRRIPRIARLAIGPSPSLIRWTLRIVTVGLFGAATAVGVSLGMSAPEITPTPVVNQHVALSDR